MHALWIEWRQTTLQTAALLALTGADDEPDAHGQLDDLFTPSTLTRQDPEARRALIARLAAD